MSQGTPNSPRACQRVTTPLRPLVLRAESLVVSLLSKHQIVAFICALCAIWLFLLFGHMVSTLPFTSWQGAQSVSAVAYIEDFARGSVDTRPIVSCLSGTAFLLFIAVRTLESRRWR